MSPEVQGGPSLLITLILISVMLIYLRGWYRLRPSVLDAWRVGAFVGGLCLLWVAIESPLAAMDHQLLIAHMAQHLLLMTVCAPLILLGKPIIVLRHGLPQSFVRRTPAPILRYPPVYGFGRAITHPVFCGFVATAVVIGWHIPVLFEVGMRSVWWHEIEQASFLAAGLLFWWPVIQPKSCLARWSQWGAPLYLFLATLPCDALSAFLTFCNRVVYPHYMSAHRHFDISPLRDQECAGALMWVWVTFAYLVPAVVVTLHTLSPYRGVWKAEAV